MPPALPPSGPALARDAATFPCMSRAPARWACASLSRACATQGGADILMELHKSGELEKMLKPLQPAK